MVKHLTAHVITTSIPKSQTMDDIYLLFANNRIHSAASRCPSFTVNEEGNYRKSVCILSPAEMDAGRAGSRHHFGAQNLSSWPSPLQGIPLRLTTSFVPLFKICPLHNFFKSSFIFSRPASSSDTVNWDWWLMSYFPGNLIFQYETSTDSIS